MRGRIFFLGVCLGLPLAWVHAGGGSLSFVPQDFPSGSLLNVEVDYLGRLTLTASWDIAGNNVPVRYYPGFAYDETRSRAILFGGLDSLGNSLGDTWLWDAASSGWSQVSAAQAPSARYGHALAWIGDRFLLYGGAASTVTWVFDPAANAWDRLSTNNSPPGDLIYGAMAYDSNLNKAVLFGGGATQEIWVFDVGASSWSNYNLSTSPQARLGAAMAYDKSSQRVILFGGKKTGEEVYLNDTWSLDLAGLIWTQMNPASAPSVRADAGMVYDAGNGQVVLYGGRTDSAGSSASGIYYYSFSQDRWMESLASNNNEPPARFGYGMVYDAFNKQTLVFGGKVQGSSLVSSLWRHTLRSSGTALSNPKSVPGSTAIAWGSLTASFSGRPAQTDVLFQAAASSEGVAYDLFRGPGGSTSTFYSSSSTPLGLWSGLAGKRYVKWKAYFLSDNPPARPVLSGIEASYNQAPTAPDLNSPANDARINSPIPVFRWSLAVDNDGLADLPLSYEIYISTSWDFIPPFISQDGLGQGASDVSFSTPLAQGLWHWRARAKDNQGFGGDWSSAFSVTNDTTTPPGPVTQAVAGIGPANGQIALNWTFPGDDKGSVDGGRYRVRYGTSGPISDEDAWASLAGQERTGLLTAASGQALTTIVDALATAVTYYFALKTEDELGNLSSLSTVSPYAMTNASPTVTQVLPAGGEIFTGTTTIAWLSRDPNPGDTLEFDLLLSSDSGASYGIVVASALASSATFYFLDTRGAPNGSAYRIRVVGRDARGLEGWSQTASDFRMDNVNEPPRVTFTQSPSQGQRIQGLFTLAWSAADPNAYQSIVFDVFLSADAGLNYVSVARDIQVQTLTLDTLSFGLLWKFGNLTSYKIKVTAKDSGAPSLSGEAVTGVFEAVTSPDGVLSVTRPLENDFPTVFDLNFAWQPYTSFSGSVLYTLNYSTDPLFSGGVIVSSLAGVSYKPALGSLLTDTTYYWKVKARDILSQEASSLTQKFMVSKFKAKSADGTALVQVISGMPSNGFISIEPARSLYGPSIDLADQRMLSERLKRSVGQSVWLIELRDISGQMIPAATATAMLSLAYADQNGDGFDDTGGLDAGQLKIAKLNVSQNQWQLVETGQSADLSAKSVTAAVEGFSVFTLLGAAPLSERLSGVTNFPNPFRAGRESTRIRYALTQNADVTIKAYTLLGDLVKVFELGAGTSGGIGAAGGYVNEVLWDGLNADGVRVANGMYAVSIKAKFLSGGEETHSRYIGVVK